MAVFPLSKIRRNETKIIYLSKISIRQANLLVLLNILQKVGFCMRTYRTLSGEMVPLPRAACTVQEEKECYVTFFSQEGTPITTYEFDNGNWLIEPIQYNPEIRFNGLINVLDDLWELDIQYRYTYKEITHYFEKQKGQLLDFYA
jgi:hypothetical protein